jgi:hypothetical protein
VANEIKRRKLSSFHAQELSNLVWGFSTVGEKDGQLLELIEEEAVRRGLQEFKSQVICCDSFQISLSLIFGCVVLCLGNLKVLLLFVSSLKMAHGLAAVEGLGTQSSPLLRRV